MIGIEQHAGPDQIMFRRVRKPMSGIRNAAGEQHRRMGDGAQGEDHSDLTLFKFCTKKIITHFDFQR